MGFEIIRLIDKPEMAEQAAHWFHEKWSVLLEAYLITDQTSFYERYGWKFLCMVQGDGEPGMSRMYIHTNAHEAGNWYREGRKVYVFDKGGADR